MNNKNLTHEITMQSFFADNNYHGHRHNLRPSGGAPLIYFVHGSFAQLAGGIVVIFLGMLTVAVVCCVLVRYRRKLSR